MRKLFVSLLAALALVITTLSTGFAVSATAAPAPAGLSAAPSAATVLTAKRTVTKKKKKLSKKQKAKKKAKRKAQRKRAAKRHAAEMRTWDRLAHCEATGRWHINSGNGYYGGLQIHPRTWAGFGGKRFAALPHHATRKEQIRIGQRIRQGQGWGAWPACSRKLGLR